MGHQFESKNTYQIKNNNSQIENINGQIGEYDKDNGWVMGTEANTYIDAMHRRVFNLFLCLKHLLSYAGHK